MKAPVHIWVTVRNPALLDAALLVFKTIRTGFPTAQIVARGNHLEVFAVQEVARACAAVGADFANAVRMSHDAWIEHLLGYYNEPFWVCDTDLVFFDSLERFPAWDAEVFCAGRLEPEFNEEWTKTVHVERLHTCLMYLDPVKLRHKSREWMGQFPQMFHTGQMNLVRQQFIPVKGGKPLFYDTCAGIWQALGGVAFSDEQNGCFEHLHCGTYADLISPHISLHNLAAFHKAVYAQPGLARGLQAGQAKYYRMRSAERSAMTAMPGAILVVGAEQAHVEKG